MQKLIRHRREPAMAEPDKENHLTKKEYHNEEVSESSAVRIPYMVDSVCGFILYLSIENLPTSVI
jgi:hypothetical protein